MEQLLSIGLISVLFRAVGLTIGIYVLVGIMKQAYDDYKNKGYKGIINEIILGTLVFAGVGLATLTANGPAIVGSIADRVVMLIVDIINLALEAIEGLF